MARANTPTSYGTVTKSFHWLTALLIFAAFPLGYFANDLAQQIRDPNIATTDADLTRVAILFSLHKTIGVAIFFAALGRIFWALGQTRPGLLNGDKPLEAWAAATVHWLLYGSLVVVPLTGWIHHAATTGFAPIWWPFGQDLPFVPKDENLAGLMSTLHFVFMLTMLGSLGLHIAGALKHHIIDQDATLRRMLPGRTEGLATEKQPGHGVPFISALAVWGLVLGGAGSLGWYGHNHDHGHGATDTVALEEVASEWQVTTGALELSMLQFNSKVTGNFADWTADISYSETPDAEGKHGAVTVTVGIASLTLGSVTDQAKGPGYFDLANHPTALFEADILASDTGHTANGTLTIKGASLPVEMPFDLTLDDDIAVASGTLTVDRRDFGIGLADTDEGQLGFGVDIQFSLEAILAGTDNNDTQDAD